MGRSLPPDGEILGAILLLIDDEDIDQAFGAPVIKLTTLEDYLSLPHFTLDPYHVLSIVQPVADTLFPTPRHPVLRLSHASSPYGEKNTFLVFERVKSVEEGLKPLQLSRSFSPSQVEADKRRRRRSRLDKLKSFDTGSLGSPRHSPQSRRVPAAATVESARALKESKIAARRPAPLNLFRFGRSKAAAQSTSDTSSSHVTPLPSSRTARRGDRRGPDQSESTSTNPASKGMTIDLDPGGGMVIDLDPLTPTNPSTNGLKTGLRQIFSRRRVPLAPSTSTPTPTPTTTPMPTPSPSTPMSTSGLSLSKTRQRLAAPESESRSELGHAISIDPAGRNRHRRAEDDERYRTARDELKRSVSALREEDGRRGRGDETANVSRRAESERGKGGRENMSESGDSDKRDSHRGKGSGSKRQTEGDDGKGWLSDDGRTSSRRKRRDRDRQRHAHPNDDDDDDDNSDSTLSPREETLPPSDTDPDSYDDDEMDSEGDNDESDNDSDDSSDSSDSSVGDGDKDSESSVVVALSDTGANSTPSLSYVAAAFEGLPFGPDVPALDMIKWVRTRWMLLAAEVAVVFVAVCPAALWPVTAAARARLRADE